MVTCRGVQRRLSAAARALISSGAESPVRVDPPTEPQLTVGNEWWDLFPFTAHRIELAPGIHTCLDGTDAAKDLRTEVVLAAAGGSLAGLSVVDLGSLEGAFALEFARRGATHVLGVEARPLNARRCQIAASLLGLPNVTFRVGDVNRAILDSAEPFDIVFASGILYHLATPAEFLRNARKACRSFAVIDTHVADAEVPFKDCSQEIVEHRCGGDVYRGRAFWEFDRDAAEVDRNHMLWAAWDNPESFWPFEADLVRMMYDAGFARVEKIDTSHALERWRVDPRSRVLYVCHV